MSSEKKNLYLPLVLLTVLGLFLGYKTYTKRSDDQGNNQENQPHTAQIQDENDQFIDVDQNEMEVTSDDDSADQSDEDFDEGPQENSPDGINLERFKDEISQNLERQIDRDYQEFFEAQQMEPEQKNGLIKIFIENKNHQQDLVLMLLDKAKTPEEVFLKQGELAKEQQKKMDDLIKDEPLKRSLAAYQNSLIQKIYFHEIDQLFRGSSLPKEELSKLKEVLFQEESIDEKAGKSVNLVSGHSNLDFTKVHFQFFQKILTQGAGDGDFLESAKKDEEARIERAISRMPQTYQNLMREKLKSQVKNYTSILESV